MFNFNKVPTTAAHINRGFVFATLLGQKAEDAQPKSKDAKDESGKVVMEQKRHWQTGEPVFETFNATDELGNVVEKQRPVMVPAQEAKTDDEGNILYGQNITILQLDEDGQPDREASDVYLSVLKPIDLRAGVLYQVSGRAWVTFYDTGKKTRRGGSIMGRSITAETLAPVQSAQKSQGNN